MSKIDCINRTIGRAVSWLTLLMVFLMSVTVIQRYVFSTSYTWEHELILFMHSIVFLATAGYTLLGNEHVRVDILYEKMSERKKALVDLVGTIVFLFPIAIATVWLSSRFIINSWSILEQSREPDGIQGVFIIKTFIWIFAGTLILQGISTVVRSVKIIRDKF